ncbi:AAA family ATPase [Phenylobacterium sp. J367]|nr:AAA family ATPase [Phenylobacterium sp. J367]
MQARGLVCVAESARAIIREHGGRPPLPFFANMMLQRDLAHFQVIEGPALFDRTIVDAWATFPTPEGWAAVSEHRYNPTAFIAPPWREIYVQDAERDQTWDEAVASYELCAKAYADAGYVLLELPKTDVETRAEFVLAHIADQVSTNAFSSTKSPGEAIEPST